MLDGLLVNVTPRPLYPQGKTPCSYVLGAWVDLSASLYVLETRNMCCPAGQAHSQVLTCTTRKAAGALLRPRKQLRAAGVKHCLRQRLTFSFQTIIIIFDRYFFSKVVTGRILPAGRLLCKPGLVTVPTTLWQVRFFFVSCHGQDINAVIKNDAKIMLPTSKLN